MKDKTVSITLEELIEDLEIYPRTQISGAHVLRLKDAILAGESVPPIIVDRKSKRIVDGFHRYRAHRALKLDTMRAMMMDYATERDLVSDVVARNSCHGLPYSPFDRKRCVDLLRRYKIPDTRIVEVLHITKERIIEIREKAATGPTGDSEPVKRSLESSLSGRDITQAEHDANQRSSGMQPTFHARQLVMLLEAGLWPKTAGFAVAMRRLCELWEVIAKKQAS